MTFKIRDDYLANRLQGDLTEADLEEIFRIVDRTPEPTKTVLGYIGDISALTILYDLDKQQHLFGGYGVLSQLVSRFGDRIIPVWRGSDDIDMQGSRGVLNALRSTYDVTNDRESPNLENKITLKLGPKGNVDTAECKIDYTLMKDGDTFSEADVETIYVLGIPVRVATPSRLIKGKLEPAEHEESHFLDVLHMVGVLEHRKIGPGVLAYELDREQKAKLYELAKRYVLSENGKRIDLGPSGRYLRELKDTLKRG